MNHIVTGDDIWISYKIPEAAVQVNGMTLLTIPNRFWALKSLWSECFGIERTPYPTTIYLEDRTYCQTLLKRRWRICFSSISVKVVNIRLIDLNPSDYHLFPKLKDFLVGTIMEITKNWKRMLATGSTTWRQLNMQRA